MKHFDLHTHSTCSDWTVTPAHLIDMVKAAGLCAVALTDHDTMEGVGEAIAKGVDQGIEVIPGIEISTKYNHLFMHILGYGISGNDPIFVKRINRIQEGRRLRNERIFSNLRDLGHNLTMEDLNRYTTGGQVGRPHIARLLMDKKIVSSMQKAFSLYLRRGGKAYADRFRYEAKEAIGMIRDAGGISVLAHPVTVTPGLNGIKELVDALKNIGLDGIEVYHPSHPPTVTKALEQIALERNMVITGGSDFHGDNKPGITLAGAIHQLNMPYSVLIELKKRLK